MKNFYDEKFISNCRLISYDVLRNAKSRRHLRPDLFGLPLDFQLRVESLLEFGCYLLGSTMLNCYDLHAKRPIWSYQRVDLSERQRIRKTKKLRRGLKKIKNDEGFTRGHLSTMSFGMNDEDAKASCDYKNITPQTPRQNQICEKWENTLWKRMEAQRFIGHITTVVVYEGKAHSMYKVLFEEHVGQSLQVKCYLMYDANGDHEDDANHCHTSESASVKFRERPNYSF